MFPGAENLAPGELSATVEAAGGSDNAAILATIADSTSLSDQ